MKKTMLLLALCAMFVGCEDKFNVSNNPLKGLTYKHINCYNGEWETFTFYSNTRYKRETQQWVDAGIKWEGYYSIKNDIIYCYYDKLPKEVEFTMTYKGDSIIKDERVFYKQ